MNQQSNPRVQKKVWNMQGDSSTDHAEEKLKKKLAVQNFIENAKKNKFSEWRKSKMNLSDNNSEGDWNKFPDQECLNLNFSGPIDDLMTFVFI